MNLHPSEFIAKTHKGSPHTTRSPALSYAHPRILGLLDGMKRRTVMRACEFLSKDYMTFDAGGGCA